MQIEIAAPRLQPRPAAEDPPLRRRAEMLGHDPLHRRDLLGPQAHRRRHGYTSACSNARLASPRQAPWYSASSRSAWVSPLATISSSGAR